MVYMSQRFNPGLRRMQQLYRLFLGRPYPAAKFAYYVAINVSGLNVAFGRLGVS
jgi:hypothetical protein